jgi:probable rRNA maturation factor
MRRAPTGRQAAPAIDIQVRSPLWDAEPAAVRTVRAAIAAAAASAGQSGEISVVLADDATIRRLNRRWRGIDNPTNVLSFPAAAAGARAPSRFIGDVVIAYETLARESSAEGKPLLHHLAHLAVHGFLHLVGHDHETDSQAEAMEALERDILSTLRIADPYRAHEPGNA